MTTGVHVGAVIAVAVLRVVGVDGVSVVGGEQETAGQHSAERLFIVAQGEDNAAQRIPQKGGCRALLCLRAYLLIVENAQYRQRTGVAGGEKALQAAPGAGQIVQPGGEDILAVRAKSDAPATAVEKQIAAQHVVRTDTGCFRRHGQNSSGGIFAAEQGDGVYIGHVLHAVVGVSVHVDGHAGDHQQVAVDVHQLLIKAAVPSDEQPSGYGERSVKPSGHQHSTVLLGVQPNVAAAPQLGVLLQLKGRGVAVGGGHHKAASQLLRHAEGDDAGAAADDEAAVAGTQRPTFLLGQWGIPSGGKAGGGVGDGVETGGAGGNKIQQGKGRSR